MTFAKSGAAALCLTLTCAASDALAHHPSAQGNTRTSGPVNTISASTLAKGERVLAVVVEQTTLDELADGVLSEAAEEAAAFGDHAHVHSVGAIRTAAISFAYGVTDNLTLSLRLPHVTRDDIREAHAHEESPGVFHGEVHDLGDSRGVGDVTALLQWRFFRNRGFEAATLIGVEAPTGETKRRTSHDELFGPEFQPGSGAWSALAGIALTRRIGAASIDASAVYVLAGDRDRGDRFNYGFAVSRRLLGARGHIHEDGSAHEHGSNIDLAFEVNGEWHEARSDEGALDENSGGHIVYASPGARYTRDRFSAFVSVGIPVSVQTDGLQDDPQLRLTTGVALRF